MPLTGQRGRRHAAGTIALGQRRAACTKQGSRRYPAGEHCRLHLPSLFHALCGVRMTPAAVSGRPGPHSVPPLEAIRRQGRRARTRLTASAAASSALSSAGVLADLCPRTCMPSACAARATRMPAAAALHVSELLHLLAALAAGGAAQGPPHRSPPCRLCQASCRRAACPAARPARALQRSRAAPARGGQA